MKRFWHSLEERKRFFEAVGILVVTVIFVALSRLESDLFDLSKQLTENQSSITTIVYFGLININVLLILVLTFLIFRNGVKLVIERRRGVIGSRLRTKLVITLIFFALAPTALMFYVSTRFLTESFETWFSSKVEETMLKTREAGAIVYKRDQRRIESLARIALQKIEVEKPGPFAGPERINVNRLAGFTREYRLYDVKVFDIDLNLLWSSKKQNDKISNNFESFVYQGLWRFKENPGLTSKAVVDVDAGRDVVRGIAPIYSPHSSKLVGLVVTEERFETQIIQSVEAIIQEFASLKPGAKWGRLSYLYLLVLMALIIFFSATWLGFFVSRGIIAPIQSLGEATREVALGNYEVRLSPKTDDETGQLVRSFNSMTADLKANERQLLNFTDRLEQTNEELERRRRYMEVVLKNISAGVISVDAGSLVTTINSAAEKLLGIEASKVLNRDIRDSIGDDLKKTFWNPIVETIEHSNSFHGQIDLNSFGRNLTLIADGVKIQDEQAEDLGMVIVFDDASEQVKVQRVAAWREVARRIAHEIKNPITPIKLSAQRLLRRFEGNFEGKDHDVFRTCIETIIAEVDGLRDLVNEFSKFSRLPTIKTTMQDINQIIRDSVHLYSFSFSNIKFSEQLDEGLPKLALDKEQISRVFSNLISNSISAVENIGRPKEIILKSTFVENFKMVRVEIIDNGLGIPKQLKDKVFEPYVSTKKDGTGLGLAIVNQIIADHGGYVRVSDTKPHGTTMVIELPIENYILPG